ncbi:cytoplasmic dynein 2 heavy chain 1 isoform X3 [Takifugu rubripes]|uniref:cytoplasmic dynein 2 heavy chain 1 isoform X3 n=1 Tax=Takifugu rubripes TaxID=31033 RepID=UPI001145379E|nr:cytoplasmic dynein 2 heavy chain 1 isoform X3 [Takifugu rubripes]
MTHSWDDPRKKFLLDTAGNLYGLRPAASLTDSPELNNFLDDANEFLLSVSTNDNDLHFSNKIDTLGQSSEKVLVFFKMHPTVITEDNLHQSILVSSMLDSPINSLYQAVRQVFAPLLLKHERWHSEFDPKMASLLSELELGLGSLVRQSGAPASRKNCSMEENVLGILAPIDEFQYWADVSESAEKNNVKERAAHFTELFKPIQKEFAELNSMSMSDVMDLVEQCRHVLDDVWRQTDFQPYPQTRMIRLMDVIGGALERYVQRKLSGEKLFQEPFACVSESLRSAINICEQWVVDCEHLTGQVWRGYTPYPWKENKHCPQMLNSFVKRLDEVATVRVVHEKLLLLLSGGKQKALSSNRVYEPFSGINPLHYNPYTEPLWKAAVAQFERLIKPLEQEAASRLKSYIADVQDSPQQLLQVFQKQKELIKRPTISQELQSERETLLARLHEYNKDIKTHFESRCHGLPGEKSGPFIGRNLPEVVNKIVWVRQLIHKVEDSIRIAEALLTDLSGFKGFLCFSDELLEVLKAYEQEEFAEWSREILSGLADPNSGISLQASHCVMDLDHGDGRLKIHYSDRLGSLVREVRQLTALGFTVPAAIQQAANTAEKFYRQAMVLKQVAHFYSTIEQQMIPSQRPMMLVLALAFEQIIKNPRSSSKDSDGRLQITWNNPRELESYIIQLQDAAEKLSTENRKLRKWHSDFTEKVLTLMNVDLLKHQQRWKDGLNGLRIGFATLQAQGFRSDDMQAWRQHWNHQLYKALEHQYQKGLEALNKNLPEIQIDLTFKQGLLQFRPPFEEVRARYFREMKRFISIPNQFKGVSAYREDLIFNLIVDRNASGFISIFNKAEDLFSHLKAIQHKFQEWLVLGLVDLEKLVERHMCSVEDWERNFKALKVRGKESESLPSQEKVDCITVNCEPVKNVIDDLIQRLFDILLVSLRKSIQGHIQTIESFVSESLEILSSQPESLEEIGEANTKYNQIIAQKNEILPHFQHGEEKNRLLRAVAGAGVDTLNSLKAKWDKLELFMESHQLMIQDQMVVMRNNAAGCIEVYRANLERFKAHWDQLKPKDEMLVTGDHAALLQCLQTIKDKQQEFQELELVRTKLLEDCACFNLDTPDFSSAEETNRDLDEYRQMWGLYEVWQQGFTEKAQQDWIVFRKKTHVFEEFLITWQERLRKLEQPTTMSVKLQAEVDKYKCMLPVLKYVQGEHLSQEHWLNMFRLLGLPRGTTLEKLTFGDLLSVASTIGEKALELKDLNTRAQEEVTIREALRELELWGAAATFNLTEYTDSNKCRLLLIKDWRDIVNQVGDNRCLLQSLKDSPYYHTFRDKVRLWEVRLSDLDEYLLNLNSIQRRWVYLEPIFGRGALPREEARFKRVDEDFRSIISDIQRDNRVLSLSTRAGIRIALVNILDQLQRCQKCLNEFLEEKRSAFPRFYFIGDDDLLEILGQATNPHVIQLHLKKLFGGIHSVVFDEQCQHILAMCSLEGEIVPLKQSVQISSLVEEWLSQLSAQMKDTLKQLLYECVSAGKKGEVDPSSYPLQILCLAEQIQFTEDVESALKQQNLLQLELNLTAKLEHYTTVDTSSVDQANKESTVLQLKLKALILDVIHNISVVKQLKQAGVTSPDSWAWRKQLRFYMDTDRCCVIHMVDAHFSYTYEYQGNAAKLVHTPLTDKCYLTLTQAMKMGLGGNPYGPAGTGKTESVKALGALFGRQVLVFNCDEGIDVKSMGRIFVGLLKCGAWGCFDEFNRLEESVLSAVSMQIQAIQDSLKHHKTTCDLLGKEVELDLNSGVFITLNPAGKGYGGRQKLPDNLKQLFRPVAMSRPDNELIAEVILYSEGFKNGDVLGHKLVAIFNLARELLTPQQHYDWGLRALKTVLNACGKLLQQEKHSREKNKVQERDLVVQALRLNTMSKLTFADTSRFDALVKDVFSGVHLTNLVDQRLVHALEEVYKEAQLELTPSQLKKALELHEQLRQRMGVVIVGPSGAGKSTLWRMLRAALIKTDRVVRQYIMNPKAMPRQQLLGQIDMDTREWTDGVLTNSARNVVREPQEVSSWIICDGDIDPEWIESLNSVLDDNRLLTLPSGERIQFGPNVNFIFESHDLSCASPATISRMGMIFVSDQDTDVNALLNTWVKGQPEQYRENLNNWLGDYFQQALDWIFKQNDFVVETTVVGTIFNGLSHLSGVTERGQFIIGLLRGLGGNINFKTRQEFAKELLSWARESPPNANKPLDTYYDFDCGHLAAYTFQHPKEQVPEQLGHTNTLAVIETPAMQRALHGFSPWLTAQHRQPFMIVGPEGCGKGMLLRHALSQLRSTQVAMIHCSAQTSSRHVLQKLSQTCLLLSSNTGRVFRPKDCENLVLYLKDISLPKPDKWGTCNLIAFLQQVLTYNGFYNESLEWVSLENIQVVASMSTGCALGSHPLTPRFSSIVRICTIDYPDREQLQTIYSVYLQPILQQSLGSQAVWASAGKTHQLAGSLVELYEQTKARFTVDDHRHYLFTPCVLTEWVLSLLRYDLTTAQSHVTDSVLEAVAYEARRLFRDRLVSSRDLHNFDNILSSIIRGEWGSDVLDNMTDGFYVTWGASEGTVMVPGQSLPPNGKPLGRLDVADLSEVIQKGVVLYSRDNRELDLLLFREVCEFVSRVDRVLSRPGGSLLLAGRSGVGRHTATYLVSHMHGCTLFTPKVSRGYSLKHFSSDLRAVMQLAGIEGQQVVLLLEDYQFVHSSFLEMVNSLLSSGEIPGLYMPEELDPLLSCLKDAASQDGFTGPLYNYFSYRVQQNLHIVLIMDCSHSNFSINCESNPAFYRKCSVQWMEGWSESSMLVIPELLLAKTGGEKIDKGNTTEAPVSAVSAEGNPCQLFLMVHESCRQHGATPSQYLTFLHLYATLCSQKKSQLTTRQKHLQAGVSKLNEAKALVDELKRRAAEQRALLKTKQQEADSALQEITTSMQNASDQKTEMEKIQWKMAQEMEKIEERKAKIDDELKEVQPLVDEAKHAVGNIKPEALSEIRSLRMPPDVIRDILEGVLRLMGIFDTSWVSMKSFLSKRGVREDIATFEARNISTEIRQSVEELLQRNKASFDPKNAKRASAAAAPLAAWVKANVQYSHVLERIEPLEREQAGLMENLRKTESKKNKLENQLNSVGAKVNELKEKFQLHTTEAAKLEAEVTKAQNTITAAQQLISQLDGEHRRWNSQMCEITAELDTLPLRALLAAAFITYLSAAPEDRRRHCLEAWTAQSGLQKFDLRSFLSTESEQLIWKSQGLPSDDLSMENALIILQSVGYPFLIDPSSRATEWLCTHLQQHRLEVISQQDANFMTSLELAVRFGKILIIREMDGVEPALYPLLRRDLIAQGPRYVVQIGEKLIDYNEDFRLFMATRNPTPFIPPDVASVMTEVNFTTTRAGLRGQLLALTIQQEKPELETEKNRLLQMEEENKIQLTLLEETLLETLATAQGNILDNRELVDSLNQTKASSTLIQESLLESHRLQTCLDQERNAYLPLAESASKMYFVITDLSKINNMYRFSLAAFLHLFQRALQTQEPEDTDARISALESKLKFMVYEYVCRSLFKEDQLMFALHFVKGIHPEIFKDNEWEVFTGSITGEIFPKEVFPSWIDQERHGALAMLKTTFPDFFQSLCLKDSDIWLSFLHSSQCEQEIPLSIQKKISPFQQLLLIQALRPDRLQSAMGTFATQMLGMKELYPPPLNLHHLYTETKEWEPVLIIISPGADPSQELADLAAETMSRTSYHEISMGQGQADVALATLRECSQNGEWLCLKNLHLVTTWLPLLEKELNGLRPKAGFRLWLTAEVHPRFPPILLQSTLKITYESPPGLKKNLLRTYESWTPEQISKGGNPARAQSLFCLAWFHAVCQERRNYIPQGWTKFYEFSLSDLRASFEIIDRLFEGAKPLQLEFVHGLLESAIYGGHIDNPFDLRILRSYLEQFFSTQLLSSFCAPQRRSRVEMSPFIPAISLPNSCTLLDYRSIIETLPEDDRPVIFGLPANIERSSQRIISSQVISQLRVLSRSVATGSKFDRELWSTGLSPVLHLWRKINQGSSLIHQKVDPPTEVQDSPIHSFILLEQFSCIRLVQSIHQSLAALSKVIRGSQLLTPEVQKLASALLNQECPLMWQKEWEGPEEPLQYLRAVVTRAGAIKRWAERAASHTLLADILDLSELLHPDTFLNALRQETARSMAYSMDELVFVSSWSQIVGAKLQIKVGALQLEGCSFDGVCLCENQHNSPSVSAIPTCYLAWVLQNSADSSVSGDTILLPLYTSSERVKLVTHVCFPCGSNPNRWIQSGAALFLKQQ